MDSPEKIAFPDVLPAAEAWAAEAGRRVEALLLPVLGLLRAPVPLA